MVIATITQQEVRETRIKTFQQDVSNQRSKIYNVLSRKLTNLSAPNFWKNIKRNISFKNIL